MAFVCALARTIRWALRVCSQLEQQQDMLEQYAGNTVTVRNALGTAESTLTSIGSILQRVNELAIASGNGSFTDSDRKANADELARWKTSCST